MNKVIEGIVMEAYYKAKRDFELQKDQLDADVNHRGRKEQELATAKSLEASSAFWCQGAADRLQAITEFLKSAGVFDRL